MRKNFAGSELIASLRPCFWAIAIVLLIFLGSKALKREPPGDNAVEWTGSLEPHPRLGFVYRPYSILKTFYADNPRGYFKREDPRETKWWLRAEGGSLANLVFPSTDPESVRIEIKQIQSGADFDVQVNLQHLSVSSHERYRIMFQARADDPRIAFVGFARGHAPWTGLGLYSKIELRREWQNFQLDFTTTDDEENARIHFDLGSSIFPVDLTSVRLVRLSNNEIIHPEMPSARYSVSYRFNQQGCRGRDYVVPKPEGTVRIVLLDGSFALGVGVYEEHTFAHQLERLLNLKKDSSKSSGGYEVINCGINGYGILENRLFYELYGMKYEPDVVLLILPRFWEEMLWVDFEPAGSMNRLILPWANTRKRVDRPTPDLSQPINEIVTLSQDVRNSGARMGLVLFRLDSDYEGNTDYGEMWNELTNLITLRLEGTDVPLLDLGKALFKKHSYEELVVSPRVDQHPNEIAHSIAAAELENFLQGKKLIHR